MATHSDPLTLARHVLPPPAPDQPAYKNDGDAVAVGDVIGLIEVMKSFHEVKAGLRRHDRALPHRQRGAGDGRPAARRGRDMSRMPVRTLLIANRGEIAVRIIRAAQRARASAPCRSTATPTRTRSP